MKPGFLVTGGFSSLLVLPPSWRDPCMEAVLKFLISKMHISPPSTTEQPKTGSCGKTRKGTCCWLSCAALGGECELLHGGGSAVFHQKRKSILSAQPPSSQDPTMLKTRLLFPAAAAVPGTVLWEREMASLLCSLSTKHCRAFSQQEMGS